MYAIVVETPIIQRERPAIPIANLRRMVELARGHVENNQAGAAGVYYRMIIKDTTPPKTGEERLAHGEACIWYARWARAKNRLGEAADWYHQALNADPLATDYRLEYVIKCLLPMGLVKDAHIEAERAVRIDPTSKEVWRLLGGVEHRIGNVEESIAAYDKQLELTPDDPNAALDRSTIALDTADYETVRRLCEPVLNTDRRADALHCLAMADYREGHHERAIERYEAAVEAGCYDPALARWNKSLALHSIGRYKEGWAEHEQRGNQITDGGMSLLMKRFVQPRWDNEPPPARLHLHQEMGLGDAIAMARYAPILADRGYDVRIEVNDSLASLFERSLPTIKVMPKAVDYPGAFGVKPFDYHIPMLSLPYLFGTEIDTIPWNGPYLKTDPILVEKYLSKLPNKGKKVGLCWSSGIRTEGVWISKYGRQKSMHFDQLAPILKLPLNFVSLQVGPERQQLNGQVNDLLLKKPTWDDTAALVECLDLVITVDTSVAHLAGAMGKPTWLMMQKDGASWHFMCERPGAPWNEKSPWYPSVRLFRQKTPGDWKSVIDSIVKELKQQQQQKAA